MTEHTSDTIVTTGTATRVSDVEQKLNDLWTGLADGETALLRATTLNLLIYTNAPDANAAIATIMQVADRHPCRAIVITLNDKADAVAVIDATPTLLRRPSFGREMRTQVSCELITLSVSSTALDRVVGAVKGLLLTDQPVFLLRQGDFSPTDPTLKGLEDVLNGLIIDSADFSSADDGLARGSGDARSGTVPGSVYDLNWERLMTWCTALSQQFDAPNDRVALNTTRSVTITQYQAHAAAMLLLGWLSDRLNWRIMPGGAPGTWTARSSVGTVGLHLIDLDQQTPGIQQIAVNTQSRTYTAELVPADKCIVIKSEGHSAVLANVPLEVGALLTKVLDRSGRDTLYENALNLALALDAGAEGIGQRAGMIVVKDADALSRIAAREVAQIARHAVKRNKRFTLALSGGSTPRALFELLTQAPYRDQIPWAQTHIFWGDERDVPTDNAESNQRMARETLLDHVPLPPGNIHGILTGQLSAADAAARYAAELRVFFELTDAELPQFDLVLLGLGDDGHTASLFPHTEALNAKGEALFVANVVPQLNTTRLTLTADVINSAANVIFLVAGAKKADILYDVVRGPYKPDDHPSQRIHPAEGALTIIADQAAAARLRVDSGAE